MRFDLIRRGLACAGPQPRMNDRRSLLFQVASARNDRGVVQKVFEEHVLSHRHDVWDIHTNKDRWWVITNPTNLYPHDQFPNMDLAVTFHVGLCLRIPRGEKQKLSELSVEPFAECHQYLPVASGAQSEAEEISDFQSVGMR